MSKKENFRERSNNEHLIYAQRKGFKLTRLGERVVSIDYVLRLGVLKRSGALIGPAWSVLGNANPRWREAQLKNNGPDWRNKLRALNSPIAHAA